MTSFVPIKCGAWRRPYKMEGGGGGGGVRCWKIFPLGPFHFAMAILQRAKLKAPKIVSTTLI